jgi:hypothetical protein
MKRIVALLVVLPAFLLAGCPAVILGGGAAAITAMEDRRTSGTMIDDDAIETSVRRTLRERYGADHELFARHWEAVARSWSFTRVNELIREHNEWYPIEADLPIDLRTRDYVKIRGRSYRRAELGPEWILEHFPAREPGSP